MGVAGGCVKRIPGWRNHTSSRTILAAHDPFRVPGRGPQTVAQADTVPPYLAFPQPGLDDPAAYEGYQTRVYQDAAKNALQVYWKGSTGRNRELVGGRGQREYGLHRARLEWQAGRAGLGLFRGRRGEIGSYRSVSYALELPSAVRVGLFLLGSMRVERDLQYVRPRYAAPRRRTRFPKPSCRS